MTPQDVADESGHVSIKKFLEEGESTENIAEYPRNINMMDVSVLLAVELVLLVWTSFPGSYVEKGLVSFVLGMRPIHPLSPFN